MNITLVTRNEEVICTCEAAISEVMSEQVTIYKDVVSVKGKLQMKKERNSDLYLIDADTPRLDLEEITKAIGEMPGKPYMVLLATGLKYAEQGYKWGLFRYIQKEKAEETLKQVLMDVADVMEERAEASYCIKTHLRYLNIYYRDIKYIYKEGKNCIFITTNGEYKIRKSMDCLVKEMNRLDFIRISRGISVNQKQIESWKGTKVILHDGTSLLATRKQPYLFDDM